MRRLFMLVACVLTTLSLSACSTLSAAMKPSASNSASTTSDATSVYPTVDEPVAVIASGTSVDADPSAFGLSYACAEGYTAVHVEYLARVEYRGTVIDFADDSMLTDTDIYQHSVNVTLSGRPLAAASMIVHTNNVEVNTNTKQTGVIFEDDRVVNFASAATPVPSTLHLNTLDFTSGGIIDDVTFCVAAASPTVRSPHPTIHLSAHATQVWAALLLGLCLLAQPRLLAGPINDYQY